MHSTSRRARASSSTASRPETSRLECDGRFSGVSESLPPFQRFLDTYRGEVWRLICASVPRSEADDCFQETFIAALRAYPRLRRDSDLRAWGWSSVGPGGLNVGRWIMTTMEFSNGGPLKRDVSPPPVMSAVRMRS